MGGEVVKYWIKCLKILHHSGRISYGTFCGIQIKCLIWVIISTGSTVLFPSLVSLIIDQGIGRENSYYIFNLSLLLGITGIIMIFSKYIYQMNFFKFSQRFVLELKELFFQNLLKTNINFWSKHSAGDMFKILEDDIATIQNMITRSISTIVSNIVMLVAIISFLLYIQPAIGIILVTTSLLIIFIQHILGKKLEAIVYPLRDKVGKFSTFTNESLNNIINIEMTGASKSFFKAYSKKNRDIIKDAIKQLRLITTIQSVISSYSICSLFIVMIIGAQEVIKGNMSIGNLVSLTMYTQWMLGPVLALGNAYTEIKSNSPLFKRIFESLESPDIVRNGSYYPAKSLTGSIEFQNVNFGYSEKESVFDNLTFKIEPGEIIGITGKNGCGKTTLFRLLLRMCEPKRGDILIDQVSVKEYELDYLTDQLGCLLQNEFILSGSLREVLNENGHHSDEDVINLMNLFCLNINDFPDGLDTKIEENSSNISGGQAQKIALTRLFLKSKKVYLLDEPTSAVDLRSEEIICKNLQRLLVGKTAIIITHREKILSICQRIIDL